MYPCLVGVELTRQVLCQQKKHLVPQILTNNSSLLNFTEVASTTHIRVLEQKVVRVRKGGNSLVLTRYLRSTSCLIVFLSLLCYYIRTASRGKTGKTSKTAVLPGFCRIECSGGSGG